jgi:hypothetical protein
MFDMRCQENGIEHRLTKIKHPWTNGQVERMNRTIKEATVMARQMPKARQGLGVPQSQGAHLPQARVYPPHAAKTMQSKMMFPDRL